MTKEELIKFLKENLRVELKSSDGSCYSSAGIEVSIYLGKEPISSDSCSLPVERSGSY